LQTDTSVTKLDINLIVPNKYQPRKVFDDKALLSLSESIKNYGIINPILVRKKEDKYEIIAGERRFRAAKNVGLTEVPVIIKTASEQQMAELALIENIQRQGLSPIEEAKSYEEIMRIGNQTQATLATKLGKSQSAIANKIRLLSLPNEVQDALAHKKISERHARSLLTIDNKEKQLDILDRIIKEKLTVKEAEQIINEKEISEDEIKQAIDDIMKSLNIQEEIEKELEIKEENKKEEKEDDNMNNGNFFPNFDNNNFVNNNTSLNMMNMQSMNQEAMEPVQETVMPTMAPIQESQVTPPEPSPIPSFSQYEQPVMGFGGQNAMNNFNQVDSFMPQQETVMPQPMPTFEPQQANEPLLFGNAANTLPPVNNVEPPISEPATPTMQVMDTPLFNPNVTMPSFDSPMTYGEIPTEPSFTQEPPMMNPTSFEVPVMNQEPAMTPQVDRLTELQNLLSSNGYNFKVYSNETDNCVIIELPKN